MKNRINFIESGFKPTVKLINLNFLLALLLVSFCLIASASVYFSISAQKANKEAQDLSTQAKAKRELVASLTEAQEQRKQDQKLVERIETEQQVLQMKQTILTQLDQRETQKANGFSELMSNLANYHQPNLWLTSVTLDERHLSLRGAASQSTAVPMWIEKLSSAPYFMGREFAGAKMLRVDDKQLDFVFSSDLDEVAGGAQ